MGNLYVARRTPRKGLLLPVSTPADNSDLMFFLPKVDRAELDEIIRANLAKRGITEESVVQTIIDKAETLYEEKIKVAEVTREVKRLMGLRGNGAKLMQRGYRKWKQVVYPAVRNG